MPNNTKKEATLNIKNFHCSEHGFIKPQPSCPKCISPQSLLSKIADDWNKQAEDLHNGISPSSNEDWEKEFDDRFELESQGCSECGGFELVDRREERYPKGKYHCEYDLEKIKDFILQQRLAAQRDERERIKENVSRLTRYCRSKFRANLSEVEEEGTVDMLLESEVLEIIDYPLPKITE